MVRENEVFTFDFFNASDAVVTIKAGERLAQAILVKDVLGNSFEGEVFTMDGEPIPQPFTTGNRFPVYAREEVTLSSGEYKLVKSGLCCKVADNIFIILEDFCACDSLLLVNGVGIIDADYYGNKDNGGEICFPYFNDSYVSAVIKPGTLLGFLVTDEYLVTDDDNATAERVGGIGSTGK